MGVGFHPVERESHIAASAEVSDEAFVGEGTRVWSLARVREGAHIGTGCVIGSGAYVDRDVRIGANCKIQDSALLYSPCRLEDGVFVGPGAVLTNDRLPRAVNPDGSQKDSSDWAAEGVLVETGASVGAMAVVVAGVVIGAWSIVGAGSVVTRNVPPYALVAGVPARRIGWVGRSGHRMISDNGLLIDPKTGDLYRESGEVLEELS